MYVLHSLQLSRYCHFKIEIYTQNKQLKFEASQLVMKSLAVSRTEVNIHKLSNNLVELLFFFTDFQGLQIGK